MKLQWKPAWKCLRVPLQFSSMHQYALYIIIYIHTRLSLSLSLYICIYIIYIYIYVQPVGCGWASQPTCGYVRFPSTHPSLMKPFEHPLLCSNSLFRSLQWPTMARNGLPSSPFDMSKVQPTTCFFAIVWASYSRLTTNLTAKRG